MNSAASPALGFPPRADQKCSSPRAPRKASTRRRGSTAESRLRALGVTPKLSYAIRYWVGTHSLEQNFSAPQLAQEGLCHESCFSRGRGLLLAEGLIVQISDPVQPKPGKQARQKGLAALYVFTEAAYLLVLGGRGGRAKRTSPLAFESYSQSTAYPKHEHVPASPADASGENRKAANKAVPAQPSPVVQLLVEDGLDRGGAEVVAQTLPREVGPELLPFVLEVTKEVIAKRQQRNQTPDGLKVHLLRCLDPEVLKEARARQQAALEWARGGTGIDLGVIAKGFRSQPGFTRALDGYLKRKTAFQGMDKDAAGYLGTCDGVKEARQEVLALIRTAAGEAEVKQWETALRGKLTTANMAEGSLVWKRAWNTRFPAAAFQWAGLPAEF